MYMVQSCIIIHHRIVDRLVRESNLLGVREVSKVSNTQTTSGLHAEQRLRVSTTRSIVLPRRGIPYSPWYPVAFSFIDTRVVVNCDTSFNLHLNIKFHAARPFSVFGWSFPVIITLRVQRTTAQSVLFIEAILLCGIQMWTHRPCNFASWGELATYSMWTITTLGFRSRIWESSRVSRISQTK